MTHEAIRAFCLQLPAVTETVQWGDNLVFKVAGKIFAIMGLDGAESGLSFKATAEEFAALIEIEDIIPAPYLARAKWVRLNRLDVLPPVELKVRLRTAYDLVVARLPKKTRPAFSHHVPRV